MWIDISQNTDEWLLARIGKVTGSSIAKIMAHYGKDFGEPAKKLALKLALEQITSRRVEDDNFTSYHTRRGHAEEPIARLLYEERTFTIVTNGGFYDNGRTGSSPDGRVFEDGLIEIKSEIFNVHNDRVKKGGYPSAYKWQFVFNLKESDREWIDFVSYCSSFPEGKNLYIYRMTINDFREEFKMIDTRLAEFFKMVTTVKETILRQ